MSPPADAVVAVGVDVAEERKGLDVVGLDATRRILLSLGRLSVDRACQEIVAAGPAVVCIDSPSGWSRSGSSRTAERDLRRLGISSFSTGADPGDHPFYDWMRVGFRVFAGVADAFPLYRGGNPRGRAAEVFPAATAALLAGEHRPRHETKTVFRRRVLHSRGVDEQALPNLDRVDAALAALTGVLALEGDYSWLGDPAEGAVLLPGPSLPVVPLTRR